MFLQFSHKYIHHYLNFVVNCERKKEKGKRKTTKDNILSCFIITFYLNFPNSNIYIVYWVLDQLKIPQVLVVMIKWT